MKRDARQQPDERLEAHLDGLLSETAKREFAARVSTDAGLRVELELQRGIDAALGRSVRPGDASQAWARVQAAQRIGRVEELLRRQRLQRWAQWAAVAAVVLVVGGTSWLALRGKSGPKKLDPAEVARHALERAYRNVVDAGFHIHWECKDDREFAGTFFKRFGQGLTLATLPEGVQSLGLGYSRPLSSNTTHLLALVHGQKVIVFVDDVARDREQVVAPESGLHLFRRQVGKLVLYELTPLDRAYVLDLFSDPEHPASWYEEPP